jgi:hypothetical protein
MSYRRGRGGEARGPSLTVGVLFRGNPLPERRGSAGVRGLKLDTIN